MFNQILIVGLFAYCSAAPTYGTRYGDNIRNYASSYGSGLDAYNGGANVNAAIYSTRDVSVVPVQSSYDNSAPTVVNIDSEDLPVVLNYISRSSSVQVNQNHYGQPGSTQQSASVDEPHQLIHQVTRPVVQEVREVITPFRSVVQEIRPVQENVETVVAQGQDNAGGAGLGVAIGGGLGAGLGGVGVLGGVSLGGLDGNGDALGLGDGYGGNGGKLLTLSGDGGYGKY